MNNLEERYRHIVALLEITGLTHKQLAEKTNLSSFRFAAVNLKGRKEQAVCFLEKYEEELIQIIIQNTKYKISTVLYWMNNFACENKLRDINKYNELDYKYIDLIISMNKKFYKIKNEQIAYRLCLSTAYIHNASSHKPTATKMVKDHCKVKLKIFNWFKSIPESKKAMKKEHDLLLECFFS